MEIEKMEISPTFLKYITNINIIRSIPSDVSCNDINEIYPKKIHFKSEILWKIFLFDEVNLFISFIKLVEKILEICFYL